ncbi:MAG: hypothetical protein AMXMBFR82_26830 [Candidatus Hydrogenedentota bacterium]
MRSDERTHIEPTPSHPELGERILIETRGVKQPLLALAFYILAIAVPLWGVPALLLVRRAAGYSHVFNPILGRVTIVAILWSLACIAFTLTMLVRSYSDRFYAGGVSQSYLIGRDRFVRWSEIVSVMDSYDGRSVILRAESMKIFINWTIYDQANQDRIFALLARSLNEQCDVSPRIRKKLDQALTAQHPT